MFGGGESDCLGITDGLRAGKDGVFSCCVLAKEAFRAFSSDSVDGTGGRLRTLALSVLVFREGSGGIREAVDPFVSTLAILDTEDVLVAGFGLSENDFCLVFGSAFGGRGGRTTSPHAGALILGASSSSDFVLVTVTRASTLRAGRGGGGLREGSGGGPLGKFATTGWDTVTFSLGILNEFCLTIGLRSGICGLGFSGMASPGWRPKCAAFREAIRCCKVMGCSSSAILSTARSERLGLDVVRAQT